MPAHPLSFPRACAETKRPRTVAYKNQKKTLTTLPAEILLQIIAHVETATVLSNLSRTCHRLHTFIHHDGFRVFVQTRFPYTEAPVDHSPLFWRDAAHGLTTLERNWGRKAFIAWNLRPPAEESHDRRRQRTYFRSGQTMGYVPVVDSYEAWYGGSWTSRKEVVAWGAGAGLILRIKLMGAKSRDMWTSSTSWLAGDLNVHQHKIRWVKYLEAGFLEGRDDITSVNLLPQQSFQDPERVIIGRASGHLSLVSLFGDTPDGQANILTVFETAGRPVRSATVRASKHLLVACLSDSSVVLYSLDTGQRVTKPSGNLLLQNAGRIWSSCFMTPSSLAVGHGPSSKPIKLIDAGSGQLTETGICSPSLTSPDQSSCLDTTDANSSVSHTSIYSLAPVPTSSLAGANDSSLFLSGAYDGLCR